MVKRNGDTKKAFGLLLARELAVYGEDALERISSPAALEAWFGDLEKYEMEDVEWALREHRRDPETGRWPPTSADLIRRLEGLPEERAEMEAAKVERAIRLHGRYSNVVFDDEVTSLVVWEMGGWPEVCEWWDEWKVKEFCRRYVRILRTGRYSRRTDPVLHRGIGGAVGRVGLIGDKEVARRRLMRLEEKRTEMDETRGGGMLAVGSILAMTEPDRADDDAGDGVQGAET